MDLEELKQELRVTPEEIYKVEKKETTALLNWNKYKALHEKEISFEIVTCEGNNATEKKAKAILADNVINARRNAIESEAKYKLSRANRKRLERKFEALRSILSLQRELINKS